MKNINHRLKRLESLGTGGHVCEVIRIRPEDGQEELLSSFMTTKPYRRILLRYTEVPPARQ